MVIKLRKIVLFGIVGVLYFTGNQCNIPETITTTGLEIQLPPDTDTITDTIYQFTKRYFVVVPGDTALFYGTKKCTTSVNGNITSYYDDSVYFRTITLEGTSIEINDTLHLVYPQLYQTGKTLATINRNTITRYLVKTDTAILQVAYEDNGTRYYLQNGRQIVMPRTLVIGPFGSFVTDSTDIPMNNTWPTSPLIENPFKSSKTIRFEGYSIAKKTIALPRSSDPPYLIAGISYTNGISVKSYYSISGERVENGKIVRIAGTTVVTRTYFTERGIIDQLEVTAIQKIFSDGTIERTRERVYVTRGPEGVKIYSESEYPY